MPIVLFALGVLAATAALFCEPLLVAHRLREKGWPAIHHPNRAAVPIFGALWLNRQLRPPAHVDEAGATEGSMAPVERDSRQASVTDADVSTSTLAICIEIALGGLFVALGQHFHYDVRTVLACAYSAILLQIAIIDLHYRLVLNVLTYPAAILSFAGTSVWPGIGPLSSLLGGGAGLVVFFVIELVGRGSMGTGDTKLAGLIGLMRGFPAVLTALVAGIVVGGVVAAGLLVVGGRGRRDTFPYGPWLAIGAAASFFLMGRS